VLARNPFRRTGRYCIRLSWVLTSAVSWARLRLARLASDLFRSDHQLDRVQLVCVGRQLEDGQPVPGRDQLGHGGADMGIQAVPLDHQRAAELLVRGAG
jgi:hypothetical protein